MSTIKSSTEHLTLNADGSGKDIKFQANGVEKASISSAGVMTATSYAGDGSALTGISGGKVLQVVSATKTDTSSTTGATWVDVSSLSVSITPSSTSSKILILVNMTLGQSNYFTFVRMMRDATAIGVNTVGTNRAEVTFGSADSTSGTYATESAGMNWLDSPNTTSSTTYKMQFRARVDAGTAYVNRSSRDLDDASGYDARGVSSITVMEIGA